MSGISVIVPCRNEAECLARCLDALALQDYPREGFEVIVVDGRSTDGTAELARARGATVLLDPGRGPAGARNVGIRAARGDILAFTDADCVPRPDWLTRIAEVMAEAPDVAGVAGALRMPRETFLGRMEDDDAQAHYRGFITSNVAYRQDAIVAVGGFDESLSCAEDYDLAWRLMDAGFRVVSDPRPVVVHAPPEVRGSVWTYLRKQWWYARSDVPAQARALRRLHGRRGTGGAAIDLLPTAANAGMAAGLAAAAALRSAPLAGATLAAAVAASAAHVARATRGAPASEVAARIAVGVAQRLVRGAGTLAGCAALLTPAGRAALTARARVPLLTAAAPPAAPSARAVP